MRIRRTTSIGMVCTAGLLAAGGPSAYAAPEVSPDTAPQVASLRPDSVQARAPKKCNTSEVNWYLKGGYESYRGTNLYSDWMEGPGRITYQKTATSEANSSWTGDLGVGVDLVIAEIKSSYAKTVGKSHSVTDSWSYTAEVPAGKVRRLHQLKQMWNVRVVRWRYTTSDCKNTKEVSNKGASFPTKNRDYMWVLVGKA